MNAKNRLHAALRAANRRSSSMETALEAMLSPLLVVAAHPDDEVVGAGGALVRLGRADIVHLTDGAPRNAEDAHGAGFAGWQDYAAARRSEAGAALALVGIDRRRILGLGIPDQEAGYHLVDSSLRLLQHLRDGRYRALLAHAYEGGHPDHDAAAFAAHSACRLLAQEGATPPRLLEMTIYRADGAGVAVGNFLPHASAGAVSTLYLSPEQQALKRRMLDLHATQRAVLSSFAVERECFRAAPRYDFCRPPHAGQLHYERHPWGMTSERWCALAAAATQELGLEGAS